MIKSLTAKRENLLLENSALHFTKPVPYLVTYEKESFTRVVPALFYQKNICEHYLTN